MRHALDRLLAHTATAGAKVKGGSGVSPSAGYYSRIGGSPRSLWSLCVRPAGLVITVNLGSIAAADRALADQLLDTLNSDESLRAALTGVRADTVAHRYPELAVEELANPIALETLLRGFDDVLHTARS